MLWRRRKKQKQSPEDPSVRERSATLAASLYESLDAAMMVQGVPRPQGTPPLRHSESEAVLGHPMAKEIRTLTEIYLEARFGKHPLDEPGKKAFEHRVRAIRLARRAESAPS